MKRLTQFAMSAGVVGVLALAVAPAASAQTSGQVYTARTTLADRPDSGNGNPDTWAEDAINRTLTITRTGGGPGDYAFTGSVQDTGTFAPVVGAPTPNQSGKYKGEVIQLGRVFGVMSGHDDYSFTASELPSTKSNLGIVTSVNDHGTSSAPSSTSEWYMLAFPSGTTFFTGGETGDWSWTYDALVLNSRGFLTIQQWTDANANSDGDLPQDGNITV